MGAGKSLLSQRLSVRLHRPVLSTDDLIVKREGRPITEIFARFGEPYLRAVEKGVVSDIAGKDGIIIDCGGGVVLDPENLAFLKQKGIVFYLSATPEKIYQRIKDQTHRPLLNVPDPLVRLEELLAKRQTFYEQADYIIDTNDNDWQRVAEEIEMIMSERVKNMSPDK
ncbi:MAG TPA: shikimate kinase [Candidatus Omnitrophota bacterium]|nr:shikimate kinase [Candidatus Omnitrophota bacterium]